MKHLALFFLLANAIQGVAQNASISGRVADAETNEAIPFARLMIQGTTQGANADEDGRFMIPSLKPGLYNIEAAAPGYVTRVIFELETTADRPAVVNIILQPVKTELGEVEVRASSISNREASPLSVRTIGSNEIKRNAGGNRDISRVLRTLPGVAAIPSFRNDLIIRGGAPNENRFFIDGIEIPNINHFATQGASGGPVGLINVDLISEVELYTGAFPAARGNALSSVLEFEFRNPESTKPTLNMVAGSSDLGITLELPTGNQSGLILSARRSYLQGLFALLQLPFLPTYNDYNLKWKWRIDDKNQLTVLSLGALDLFKLNLSLDDDTTSENFERNRYLLDNLLVYKQWNYMLGTKWERYGNRGKWQLVASRNMLQNDAYKHLQNDTAQPLVFDYSSFESENKTRLEYSTSPGNGFRLLTGLGYEYARYFNRSRLPDYNSASTQIQEVNYISAFDFHKYYGFAQLSRTLAAQRLVLSAGVRADGNSLTTAMSNPISQLSPRASASYMFSPGWRFNASAGIYYQLPPYTALGYSENGMRINTALKYIGNQQVSAGVSYDWDQRNTILSLEGFSKNYRHYPVSIARGVSLANLGADFGTVGNEALLSTGLGRSYGMELLVQQKLYKGFYGIAAYTFVRSEFTGTNGQWSPSSWDSRHLVSLTAGKKLKRNWELGAVFRLSGGLPYTPDDVQASMLISNWDALRTAIPDWSALNSERISTFHQLDVRLDKKWYFERWSIDFFIDVQNIYNSSTPLKPTLDVQRNNQGQPVPDAQNPGSYLPRYLDNSTGSVLPSLGLIISL